METNIAIANTINWSLLKKQAQPYTKCVTIKDPVSGLLDVTYYGLKTKLSEVIKGLNTEQIHSISVFADTLEVDITEIETSGLLLVTRELNVSTIHNKPLIVQQSLNNDLVVQTLIGQIKGGDFGIASKDQITTVVSPSSSIQKLKTNTYVAKNGEGLKLISSINTQNNVQELVKTSWMMNSMYASFAASSWLMDEATNDAHKAAQSMLSWIVSCTTTLSINGVMPSDYSQLYNQASALLVTLNVATGATFVPILSGKYYSNHMKDIINVIRDYEGKMNTLNIETNIERAIQTVSSNLQSIADIETQPLTTQLDGIKENTNSLYKDILSLRNQFNLQVKRSNTAFDVMITQATLDRIRTQIKAMLELALNIVSSVFDVAKIMEGDVGGVKDLIEDVVKSIESLIDTIESFESDGETSNLAVEAKNLLKAQIQMLQAVLDAHLLYQQALSNKSGEVLPTKLSAITIDPVTNWNNYLITAENTITKLKRNFSGNEAKNAADDYLASLKILTGFGKAISGKFVAYIKQLVLATTVMAQLKAAKDVEEIWKKAKNANTKEEEKLAALKALVLGRLQAIKRSLYISWTYYAASYLFLNFKSPPRILHMDMDASELENALVGVSEWVAQAIGNSQDGPHVVLPNNDASIELKFDILNQNAIITDGDTAMLTKMDDGSWSLTFTLHYPSKQIEGILSPDGKVAIWIKEAAFFLKGVTPNNRGKLLSTVSTSGTYQNGVGQSQTYTFVTKGLTGHYDYTVEDENVYSPWKIDSAVYMTPSPYTQWTMKIDPNGGDPSTATELKVKLKIAYLAP